MVSNAVTLLACVRLMFYKPEWTYLEKDSLKEQFLQMVSENAGIIQKMCRLYTHSTPDSQDLFQEIIIQLWKSFPSFRGESKLSTWMYRIALNTAISHLRTKNRKPQTIGLDIELMDLSDAADPEKKEKQELLFKAISLLSELEKALALLYLEEKSYQEMEEILGISQGTLRVKMNRIKEKLRKNIQDRFGYATPTVSETRAGKKDNAQDT